MRPSYLLPPYYRTLFSLLLLVPLSLALAQDKPAAEPAWGQEVNGLACRMILPRRQLAQGETLEAFVELRNSSKEAWTILDFRGPYWSPNYRTATDKDNPHRHTIHFNFPKDSLRAEAYRTIQPGEVLRIELANLSTVYQKAAKATGEHTLAYQYTSVAPPGAVAGKLKNLWTGTITSAPITLTVNAPSKDDLTVHEWGVFTVYPELKYANADMKKEWESMPDFFYRQFPELRLKRPLMPVLKPIVYFYTKTAGLQVSMAVDFPEGAPVVWWPCAESPIMPATNAKREIYRKLQWEAWVGSKLPASYQSRFPPNQPASPDPQFAALPSTSWLNQARLEGASPVTVWGSPLKIERFQQHKPESERFIFYDGLIPAPDYLRCLDARDQGLTLKNTAAFALPDIFVVDRRTSARDGMVRFAHVPKAEAGEQPQIAFRAVAEKDWPAAGVGVVQQALLKAGLNEAEAKSLLAIWSSSFFKAEGVTVFHLLPRAEYDRRLPLQLVPRPGELARVGVILYPRIELVPVVAKRAEDLIRKLDDASFQVREQATRDLIAMGAHVFPFVRKALEGKPSLEVTMRLEKVLNDTGDAGMYLALPQPAGK